MEKENEMFWTKGEKKLVAIAGIGANVKYIGASSDGKRIVLEVEKIGTKLSRLWKKAVGNDKPYSKLEIQLGKPYEILNAETDRISVKSTLTPLELICRDGEIDYLLKYKISTTII